ncbi:PEP-CTERM sorting domain-containing protein [Glacieibacterium frigidum]|uniref:PEP-CTERM sorting domain-containing protein n=2 Tax=Glacieibacterium frigidum TaxID=2593303 RepID=A0A552UJW0_9SPHN|nr:PEP-CTERM sorting domain-containing protein [Glacieibacterium frigidum]
MDVTNDPTGLLPGYRLANTAPNAIDFAALAAIYAKVDKTQLPQTRTMLATHSLGAIGFESIETLAFVPEPGTWAMMITGFGLVGSAMRRRTLKTVTA